MENKNIKNTKDCILKATKDLLDEKGNVTIKDIAERAYVNVAAINYHFGSKDKLIQIIIEDVVNNLRERIIELISAINYAVADFDKMMAELIDLIFTFSEKNAGIINYSLLQATSQSEATNVLVDSFLKDEEFTGLILSQLSIIFPDQNEDHLFAKYLLLFSSFVVPFFLNFTHSELAHNDKIDLKDYIARYKDYYIFELKKILI